MTTRDMTYRDNPFGRLVFLVAEALKGPAPKSRAAPHAAMPRTGWLDRLDRWFWNQRQREVERYLGEAHDLADLERRLREIDRRIAARAY